MRRLISATSSEILAMTSDELKRSIRACEGRVVLSENVAAITAFIADITNSEIARAFGADMILLNGFDVLHPKISGLKHTEDDFVQRLHYLVGCPIGLNLEPIDGAATMLGDRVAIASGCQLTAQTAQWVEQLGFSFVCLTGNPGTGVTNERIEKAILLTKKYFSGLIIAGKMHTSGSDELVASLSVAKKFHDAGADIILVPAVGTVPGFDESKLKAVVKEVHRHQGLVMSAIGTSQESAYVSTIQDIAIRNKICGVDIQHIGDAGYSGLAPVENIMTLSKAIRGLRHTVSAIARSVRR